MRHHLHEITEADVGKTTITAGRTLKTPYSLVDTLGRVQPHDVGKRLFLSGGLGPSHLQVENNEQRDRRQAEERLRQAVKNWVQEKEWNDTEIRELREKAGCFRIIEQLDASTIVTDEWTKFFDR